MDIRHRVGLNIQRLRRAKGLSQEELAHLADLHRTHLSRIERGLINVTVTLLERIATVLGVKTGQLVD